MIFILVHINKKTDAEEFSKTKRIIPLVKYATFERFASEKMKKAVIDNIDLTSESRNEFYEGNLTNSLIEENIQNLNEDVK